MCDVFEASGAPELQELCDAPRTANRGRSVLPSKWPKNASGSGGELALRKAHSTLALKRSRRAHE